MPCLPQLEDGNLKFQEEIASNVRQFDENEKKAESLLDMLDEVWMTLQFYCYRSSNPRRRFFGSGNAFQQPT
jgi:hypothetical protein